MATLALSLDRRFILLGTIFSHEISLFRDYFQKVRVHINSEHIELESKFRKSLMEDKSFEGEMFFQQYETEKLKHTEDFPRILRESHYTAVYSFFEQSLFFLCDIAKNYKQSPFQVKELQGRGINQARQYLLKVANIEFSTYSDIWTNIQFYAEVRNKIVHAGGSLSPTQDKDLISKMKKFPSFTLTAGNSIGLTDDSCHEALNYYEKFLNKLISELPGKLSPKLNQKK